MSLNKESYDNDIPQWKKEELRFEIIVSIVTIISFISIVGFIVYQLKALFK